MPHIRKQQPASVILTHKGVTAYYVYKYNDREGMPREFGFDTRRNSNDDGSYDVRNIADELRISFEVGMLGSTNQTELIELLIRAGIEAGLVTNQRE